MWPRRSLFSNLVHIKVVTSRANHAALQGGRYGNTGNMQAKVEPRRQISYNMNIVSTTSSGGGLPELGVFQNEKVYTVYLDMRANDEDPTPSWTPQYAVLQPAAGDPGVPSGRIQGTPTPPYAMLKVVPEFTPELVRKCARRLIVASATMDVSGKARSGVGAAEPGKSTRRPAGGDAQTLGFRTRTD